MWEWIVPFLIGGAAGWFVTRSMLVAVVFGIGVMLVAVGVINIGVDIKKMVDLVI